MKDKIKEIGSTLFDVAKFVLVLGLIYYLLGSCDKKVFDVAKFVLVLGLIYYLLGSCDKKEDIEMGSLNVCGVELYMDDYYNNGIDWDKLGKDVDEECLQYYYENPEEICKEE